MDRAAQQTAVASLGQPALTNSDSNALLNQAAVLVTHTLGVEYGAIWNRLSDRRLVLQAGTGWNSGQAGYASQLGDKQIQNLEAQLRHAQKMESVGQLAAGVAHGFNEMLTIIQRHSSALRAKASLPPSVLEPMQSDFFAAERAAVLSRQLSDAMPCGGRLMLDIQAVPIDAAYAERHPEARIGNSVRLRVSDTGVGISRGRVPVFCKTLHALHAGEGRPGLLGSKQCE